MIPTNLLPLPVSAKRQEPGGGKESVHQTVHPKSGTSAHLIQDGMYSNHTEATVYPTSRRLTSSDPRRD